MTAERKIHTSKRAAPAKGSSDPDFNILAWMSSHSKELSMHCGKWVALKVPDGIVASSESLDIVLSQWQKMYPNEKPVVFMVPRENEGAFVP